MEEERFLVWEVLIEGGDVHEFGYAWLAALVELPVTGHPVMAVSDHGFVAQLPRGRRRSRYYLQCAPTDRPEDWPDQRIWDEIRLRLCDDSIENAVLPHIWKYQEFSAWMTDTMHDAGDPTRNGEFRRMIARERLNTLFSSPAAARLHSEYQQGMI